MDLPRPVTTAADDIRTMRVRGAALLARHAVQALADSVTPDTTEDALRSWAQRLADSRPSASSLHLALGHVIAEGPEALQARVDATVTRIDESETRASRHAAQLLEGHVVTHCNSQAQVRAILQADAVVRVTCLETRPRHQGRLTTTQLVEGGAPDVQHVVDGAMAAVLEDADHVIVGADTVARNGDVINKVGTRSLLMLADTIGVPSTVVTETLKVAPWYETGASVTIEERPSAEVWPGAPGGVRVRNPAFDVTPLSLVTNLVLEDGTTREPVQALARHWGDIDPVLPEAHP